MFNSIKKDLKRRNLHKKYEQKRLILQTLINTNTIDPSLRLEFVKKLNNLPRNSSKIRLKNRCVLTGRGKGVSRFTRLSRIKFRELAYTNQLAGWVKTSW